MVLEQHSKVEKRVRNGPTTKAATPQGTKPRVERPVETNFAKADTDAANHSLVSLDK
jgi:hypothetical protein